MSKFKVGDRARYKDDGMPCTIIEIAGLGRVRVDTMTDEYGICTEFASDLELVASSSPAIRAGTRLEIVPGVYGGVEISEWALSPRVKFDAVSPCPEVLRAAATLFNELADVLDENAGVR